MKIDIDVAAAAQILEALGCSSDPILLGHGKTKGLRPNLNLEEGVQGVQTTPEEVAQTDAYSRDAYREKIRYWRKGTGDPIRGTFYSMILDRLEAVPRRALVGARREERATLQLLQEAVSPQGKRRHACR